MRSGRTARKRSRPPALPLHSQAGRESSSFRAWNPSSCRIGQSREEGCGKAAPNDGTRSLLPASQPRASSVVRPVRQAVLLSPHALLSSPWSSRQSGGIDRLWSTHTLALSPSRRSGFPFTAEQEDFKAQRRTERGKKRRRKLSEEDAGLGAAKEGRKEEGWVEGMKARSPARCAK